MNLFLAQTAYHVLLAAGLAEQARRAGAGPSRLLAVEDFHQAAEFLAALREWPHNPFDDVVSLGPYERGTDLRRKHASARRLAAAVHRQLGGPVRALYLFNDRNVFAQHALQEVARRHPDAERIAVEDGSSAYSQQRYKRYNAWRAFLYRRRHGPGWHNLEVLGTHPLVQRFVGHYPEAFRPELAYRPHQRYPTAILGELDLAAFARALAQRLGVDPAPWQGADVVLAVPGDYVFRFNADYPQRMGALLRELAAAGLRVALKYHPRDPQPDFLGAAGIAGTVEIPRALPMEFAYLLLDARPRLALGDISSAFVLARHFNAGLRPVYFRHGPGFHDYGLGAQLPRLGVDTVESAAQLVALARRP